MTDRFFAFCDRLNERTNKTALLIAVLALYFFMLITSMIQIFVYWLVGA